MILDYHADPDQARKFAIYDRETGEMLESPMFTYFYADDKVGILRRSLRDENGRRYTWDKRTHERRHGRDVPVTEIEMAWEEIRCSFVIGPRMVGVLTR